MNQSEIEKKYIEKTKGALASKDSKSILAKIRELKSTGKISILSCILDLLKTEQKEEIKREIINLVSDLRNQKGVPVIADYIKQLKDSANLSQLFSACWQSQLNYSDYLETFADSFISGTYQDAIESFTVIEEIIMHADIAKIESCRLYLLNRQSELNEEKQPLYKELIKILTDNH